MPDPRAPQLTPPEQEILQSYEVQACSDCKTVADLARWYCQSGCSHCLPIVWKHAARLLAYLLVEHTRLTQAHILTNNNLDRLSRTVTDEIYVGLDNLRARLKDHLASAEAPHQGEAIQDKANLLALLQASERRLLAAIDKARAYCDACDTTLRDNLHHALKNLDDRHSAAIDEARAFAVERDTKQRAEFLHVIKQVDDRHSAAIGNLNAAIAPLERPETPHPSAHQHLEPGSR